MNSSKQIKLGALISYFAIAFNIVAGLIYTPWMISKIGQSNYGLYTLATSVISMFVMDFGMGAAVTRFCRVTMRWAIKRRQTISSALYTNCI